MIRTQFGLSWDDSSPLDGAILSRIPSELVQSLEHYFEDCLETGGFLRAVLENDLGSAIRKSRYSQGPDVVYAIVALLDGWAPGEAWGSKEAVAAWLSRPKEMSS